MHSGSRRLSSKQFRTLETQTSIAERQYGQSGGEMPRRSRSTRLASDASGLPQLPGQEVQDTEPDDRHPARAEQEPPSFQAALPGQELVQDADSRRITCSSGKLSRSASQQQSALSPADQPSSVHDDDAAAISHGEGQLSPEDSQQQAAPGDDFRQQTNSASSSQADQVDANFSTATPVLRAGSSPESPASSLPSAEEDDEACVQQRNVAADQASTFCCHA